jgi:hypothetical protein
VAGVRLLTVGEAGGLSSVTARQGAFQQDVVVSNGGGLGEQVSAWVEGESSRGSTNSILPEATVVLLCFKPGPHELETVKLVRAQDYPNRISLLVIDSSPNPEEPTNRAIRAHADHWEAIPPESFQHGRTRNMALELCSTPVIAFLSLDAHPANATWLASLVRPLAEGRAEASYGCQRAPSYDAERQATFSFLYPEEPEIQFKARIPELGLRTFHFSDVTSAFLTEVVRRVRFPEDLVIGEDIGVAKRLLDLGLRTAYVPGAIVYHAHDYGPWQLIHRYRHLGSLLERIGVFDELRRQGRGSLLREGLRVTRALSPPRSRGLRGRGKRYWVGALKAGGIAWGLAEGRWAQARLRRRGFGEESGTISA